MKNIIIIEHLPLTSALVVKDSFCTFPDELIAESSILKIFFTQLLSLFFFFISYCAQENFSLFE